MNMNIFRSTEENQETLESEITFLYKVSWKSKY